MVVDSTLDDAQMSPGIDEDDSEDNAEMNLISSALASSPNSLNGIDNDAVVKRIFRSGFFSADSQLEEKIKLFLGE